MQSAIQGLIAWGPLGIPAFLFVITMVIFFHELGHFLVARWCGVKVDVFSIGFGREIVGFNDRYGTRWRVSWLPIGGYVKFVGDANAASMPDAEAAEKLSPEERTGVLFFKPLWQRAAVAAAGPVANFILAIVMLTGLLLYSGQLSYPAVVGSVAKDSAAQAAGIQVGDRILSVEGITVTSFLDLPQIISIRGGENLAILLDRHGRQVTVHAVPKLIRRKGSFDEMESTYVIGVGPMPGLKPVQIGYNLPSAFLAACSQTGDIITGTLVGVAKMIQGHASPDQIRGTVGIMDLTQKVAAMGFLPLLNFIAIISVSIGLANLFPIPLLDGGHLLYYACEAVLGRPLGERAQELGFRIGVVLIVGLLLLANFHDIARWYSF